MEDNWLHDASKKKRSDFNILIATGNCLIETHFIKAQYWLQATGFIKKTG